MENKNISNQEWEKLCHRCGKCCHCKYDLIVFSIADPEKSCKYLTSDNRCEIYEKRLFKNNNCLPIKEALKKDGELPRCCAYVGESKDYKSLIFPKSIEEFWNFVALAEAIINQTQEKDKKINLIDRIKEIRKQN